jgi:D-sedoheptulose 7-phosphate isomerase
VSKIDEVVALRAAVADIVVEGLAGCAEQLAASFAQGGTLWAFGNGGSSTDAQQVVRTFLDPVGSASPLAAVGLSSDSAVVTALANDVGFDVVFARQLRAFARPYDIAVGLSTSGGSTNVLAALDAAKERGLVTVGLAGYGGGQMAESSAIDHLFAVSSSSVHRVQEVQTTIYHVLWELTQRAFEA